MFLLRVASAFNDFSVRYAIVGGYAVALHGAVRGTIDVDVALLWSRKNFEKAEQALNSIGLSSRQPLNAAEVFEFREEYVVKRNLLAWTFVNPANPAEIVDIVLTHDLKKMKAKPLKVQGQALSLISKSDLIKMKSATGREQDKADIEALKKL